MLINSQMKVCESPDARTCCKFRLAATLPPCIRSPIQTSTDIQHSRFHLRNLDATLDGYRSFDDTEGNFKLVDRADTILKLPKSLV